MPIVLKKEEKMSNSGNLYAYIKFADSVAIEPEALISHWTIYRATFDDGDISDHLVGLIAGKSGRTTSAIQTFRGELGQIITTSRRVYTLYGPPGFHEEADFVWQKWKLNCRVIKDVNVSDQYAKQIKNNIN